jgi:menaquinone-dependent protoporphyrinogen IX oxidase
VSNILIACAAVEGQTARIAERIAQRPGSPCKKASAEAMQ